jgi:hypothetical protein
MNNEGVRKAFEDWYVNTLGGSHNKVEVQKGYYAGADFRKAEIDQLKKEKAELISRYRALLQVAKNIVVEFTGMDLAMFDDDENYLYYMEENDD